MCLLVKTHDATPNLKNGFHAAPTARKDLAVLYKRVIGRVSAMSADERFETMVRAGIYTKSGKLSKNYGG